MKRRSTQLLSLFLAFALVVGLCPISARAADVVAEVTDANGNVTSYTNLSEAWKAAKGGQDRTFKLYDDWLDLPTP